VTAEISSYMMYSDSFLTLCFKTESNLLCFWLGSDKSVYSRYEARL